jgi:hypothetical protein
LRNIFYFNHLQNTLIKCKADFEEARQICCSIGFSLLAIKTSMKGKVIANLAHHYSDIAGNYWTSGSDVGCNGNFKWCSVDRALLKGDVYWGENQPNLTKGDCVYTQIKSTKREKSFLFTEECSTKMKFICEVQSFSLYATI